MKYGDRLKRAMDYRGDMIGREITRKEVAVVAGCSVQNIGMILTDSKKKDQRLLAKGHAAVSAFLKVRADWLLSGQGGMEPSSVASAPSELTSAAIEIAVLFDMIPSGDRIRRAQAFNLATTAIMQVLQSSPASK